MKCFVIIVLVAFIALGSCQPISEELKAKLMKIKEECISETKVSEELVKKAKHDGEFPDDPELKHFFVCFGKKIGFLNEEGKYVKEVMIEKLKIKFDEETAEKVVKICTEKDHGSAEENAFHLAKCFHEHCPKKEE